MRWFISAIVLAVLVLFLSGSGACCERSNDETGFALFEGFTIYEELV